MQDSTETRNNTTKMPHSVSPESTLAEDSPRTISQADIVKSEPGSQDVAMDDAPSPAAEAKPKVNLEELFDDEDSDEEFPSSAPVVKSEEESSQPALYT
jgi:DNA primase small subunit